MWDKRVKCGNKCWEAERWAENGQNAAYKTDPGNQQCWHQSRGQVVSEGVRAGSGICVADDTTHRVAVSQCLGWDKPSPGQGCAASNHKK